MVKFLEKILPLDKNSILSWLKTPLLYVNKEVLGMGERGRTGSDITKRLHDWTDDPHEDSADALLRLAMMSSIGGRTVIYCRNVLLWVFAGRSSIFSRKFAKRQTGKILLLHLLFQIEPLPMFA